MLYDDNADADELCHRDEQIHRYNVDVTRRRDGGVSAAVVQNRGAAVAGSWGCTWGGVVRHAGSSGASRFTRGGDANTLAGRRRSGDGEAGLPAG
ncbi:MAG TPA: hypothetical protein VFB58_01835 [Chloroflexota bacterium]|nr:hypothetical protein [Chloroflexota bacterium]